MGSQAGMGSRLFGQGDTGAWWETAEKLSHAEVGLKAFRGFSCPAGLRPG